MRCASNLDAEQTQEIQGLCLNRSATTLGTDSQGRTDAVYVTVPEDSVAELILHCSRTSALNFRKPKVCGWTVQPQALSIASEATQMERR